MFPETIETERLRLVRFSRDRVDLDAVHEALSRDEQTERELAHVTKSPDDTLKETWDRFVEAERRWDEGEKARYAVYPREGENGAGEFAGMAALTPHWDRRSARFSLVLKERFWGRGYAGERAIAFMRLAFDHLDLDLVSTGYFEGNENSRKAIERYVDRVGGQYEGRLRNWVPHGDEVLDLHRYTVTREQWERNRPDDRVVFGDE
ncbi:GNAT family N-acetyltransferase [Halostella sp. JP-L12]|uniref:GNAT family N-acetyltransferase n=2 Tax=Halostella TaxID=1843185 RepID=UPI000EF7FD0F|nr:GNAT family protein [Halostella sp. JP-L12]NHN48368.1 GNAT family N-acetyltransferase [Halostella sp. JP-L12]